VCSLSCATFVVRTLRPSEVTGRTVLEVGSRGDGLRPIIESWGPREYIGVDIRPGRNVDRVLSVYDLESTFNDKKFDIVISSEVIEHLRDWKLAIQNMKSVCRESGSLLLTTRSPGYRPHGAPNDHWRFTTDDLRVVLSDFSKVNVENDYLYPGVFALGRGYASNHPVELGPIAIYSMHTGTRRQEVSKWDRVRPRSIGTLVSSLVLDSLEYGVVNGPGRWLRYHDDNSGSPPAT
jgi:SAM-dependent methyltransferase